MSEAGQSLYFNEGGEQAVKKFEERHNLNSISLPCNQRKKLFVKLGKILKTW